MAHVLLGPDAKVVVLGVAAGAQSARLEAHEDGPDEFAEGGRVDGRHLELATVGQVVVVHSGPGQRLAVGNLVVVQQPLHDWAAPVGDDALDVGPLACELIIGRPELLLLLLLLVHLVVVLLLLLVEELLVDLQQVVAAIRGRLQLMQVGWLCLDELMMNDRGRCAWRRRRVRCGHARWLDLFEAAQDGRWLLLLLLLRRLDWFECLEHSHGRLLVLLLLLLLLGLLLIVRRLSLLLALLLLELLHLLCLNWVMHRVHLGASLNSLNNLKSFYD